MIIDVNDLSFKDVVEIFNKEEVTADDFLIFCKNKSVDDPKGGFKVIKSKWHIHSPITLMPKDVINLDSKVETTIGRALANRILKIDIFGDKFPYVNSPLNINEFIDEVTKEALIGTVTTAQVIQLLNSAIWLMRFLDMTIPSLSKVALQMPDSAKRLRDDLTEKYKAYIETGDIRYVKDVEGPVLQEVINVLSKDPSWMLYHVGKPDQGNHLKQTVGTFSPIFNPGTGKYDIPSGNLQSGHNPNLYDAMANMNIVGSYKRAVQTQDGGTIVKKLYGCMNPIKAGPDGSDCKTTLYKDVFLSKDNLKYYLWNYFVDGTKLILLTPKIAKDFMNKKMQFRSALYCKYHSPFEICNKCAGEIPYKTNLRSIGSTTARIGFNFVQLSMKAFHNSTIQLTDTDPFKYMKLSK